MSRPFSHYPNAPANFQIPLLAKDNVFLGDIFSSESITPDRPNVAGLFRLNKGEPLTYAYKFDEFKIIIEGEFEISDATGQKVLAKPGDVLYIPAGCTLTFNTASSGLAFYSAQRKQGEV